ncbi:MAG: hypothetical protein ACKPH7_05610 [Planktothrix sp.]|uniref:hypothetical protein n=1 Tax=Planktothrix sp. TaxID=3088171 RepID=UPI0038D4B240
MTLAELKAKAASLGLTPDDVRQHGSLTKKATWETAIAEFEQWKTAVNTHCEEQGINQWSYPEDEVGTETISVTLNETEGNNSSEDLPFDPTHILIDGEWVEIQDMVNPDELPTLKSIDERFKLWEPWMLPGASFTTGFQVYTILYFDVWGNCHVKGTDDNRWHAWRIESIVDSIVSFPFTPSEPIPTIEPEVEMNGWHRWDEKLQQWIKEDPEETLKDCYQPESESYRQQLLKRMKPYVGDCIQSEDFEQLKTEPLDEPTAAIYLGLLEESERMLQDAVTV